MRRQLVATVLPPWMARDWIHRPPSWRAEKPPPGLAGAAGTARTLAVGGPAAGPARTQPESTGLQAPLTAGSAEPSAAPDQPTDPNPIWSRYRYAVKHRFHKLIFYLADSEQYSMLVGSDQSVFRIRVFFRIRIALFCCTKNIILSLDPISWLKKLNTRVNYNKLSLKACINFVFYF